MKKSEVLLKLEKFKKALNKLEDAVKIAKDDLDRDGVIQRFEFTFELFWKTLKAILDYHGIECYSPRDCIKKAFRYGILDDIDIFFDMLEDRNLTSHTYDEALSKEIFERIRNIYVKVFRNLNLEEKI